MNPAQFWKNFKLGEEISIAGAFIYNGLRRFHELRKLDHADEIFEVFYYLSVGLERLLKIAIVLLEHEDHGDQKALEQSLITHNHLELLRRIRQHKQLSFGRPHHELLNLLSTFYRSFRYDRFSLSSVPGLGKERDALCGFFAKHLGVEFGDRDSIFGTPNDDRYRKFLRKTVQKISTEVYEVIVTKAGELNLYTYEVRDGSKAQTIFLGQADIAGEDVLWKELLIFFMNTTETSGYLQFLRDIPALDFDPGLVDEYLNCFQSDAAKAFVRDQLEHLYQELDDKRDRLNLVNVIGAPGMYFDDPEDDGLSE